MSHYSTSEINLVVKECIEVSGCDAHLVEYDMFITPADAVAVLREDDSDIEDTLLHDIYNRCPKVDWKGITVKISQIVEDLQTNVAYESLYIIANLKEKEVALVPVRVI